MAALGAAVRDRSNARVVGITGSTGKTSTKDILAALCATCREHGRRRGELQQRDRRPADALPPRAGNRGLHPRARDARPRPDRGALPDREARCRARHECRSGASRAGRLTGGRDRGEGRAGRRPAAGRYRDRPRGLPGCARRHRRRAPARAGGHVFEEGRALVDGVSFNLVVAPPGCERRRGARGARRARPPEARPRGRRALALARRGGPAPGRRPADQRRVQREPGLDARGARAPGRASGRQAHRGRARRDGRARAGVAALPPRDRRGARRARGRRPVRGRPAGEELRGGRPPGDRLGGGARRSELRPRGRGRAQARATACS